MNRFEYDFYIENKKYYVFIDTSKDEIKRIVINNQEVVNEEYTLSLNRKAYIIYYPIEINGNELVVSIDDTMLKHEYNLFLNNVSLLDGSQLNDKYIAADLVVKNGLKKFIKNKGLDILKENLLYIIGIIFFMALVNVYSENEFTLRFLLSFVIVPLFLPLIVLVEWVHNKNIIKKYKNCFRTKRKYREDR